MQGYPQPEALNATGRQPYVVVIGGINLDIKGCSGGTLEAGTSNPGIISSSPGGVGRNIAENLTRLGVPAVLLGALGNDEFGRLVLKETSEAGVDTSGVLIAEDGSSGLYLSLAGGDGEGFVAVSDMRASELITPGYIESRRAMIAGARFLVLDTNPPAESLVRAAEIAERNGVPVLIEPVSIRKAEKLSGLGIRAAYITPNTLEYRALTGTDPNPEQGGEIDWAETVCLTCGEAGVLKLKKTPEENRLFPSLPADVADENGAGDAFTAGFVAGLYHGLSEDAAVKLGIGAAVLTLESVYTVRPDLSLERITQRLEERE